MDLSALTILREVSGLELIVRVVAAVVIGSIIGVEREYKNRPAGLRTHVLVCLGAATVALLECLLWEPSRAIPDESAAGFTLTRMSAQVISGIGFLGAGTIIFSQKKVTGLTTAASLWNVACLGLLVGFGFYWLAAILCGIVMVVLHLLQKIIRVNTMKHVEVSFFNRTDTLAFINSFFQASGILVLDIDFHVENAKDAKSADQHIYTNLYTLHLPGKLHYSDIVNRLSEYENILTVRTRNT